MASINPSRPVKHGQSLAAWGLLPSVHGLARSTLTHIAVLRYEAFRVSRDGASIWHRDHPQGTVRSRQPSRLGRDGQLPGWDAAKNNNSARPNPPFQQLLYRAPILGWRVELAWQFHGQPTRPGLPPAHTRR